MYFYKTGLCKQQNILITFMFIFKIFVQGWVQICQQRNNSLDDPQYPQSCFYGRNVYSDTYFFGGKNEYAQQSGVYAIK